MFYVQVSIFTWLAALSLKRQNSPALHTTFTYSLKIPLPLRQVQVYLSLFLSTGFKRTNINEKSEQIPNNPENTHYFHKVPFDHSFEYVFSVSSSLPTTAYLYVLDLNFLLLLKKCKLQELTVHCSLQGFIQVSSC